MKITRNIILENLVHKSLSIQEIYNALNKIGIEVESYFDFKERNTNIYVGEIIECEQHPNSDRLKVCKVKIGEHKIKTIVCGAPNARLGIKVVTSIEGSKLGNGMAIGLNKIRDIESEGMLCSYSEVGVSKNVLSMEEQAGIIELPSTAVVGSENPLHFIHLDDCVYDLKLTSNRGDLYSIYGICKDLAAYLKCQFRLAQLNCKFVTEEVPHINVVNNAKRLVSSFGVCVITNTLNSIDTPLALRSTLKKLDIKCINLAVDIGNYVMYETGQPLHVYDSSAVNNKLVVEVSKKENVSALNGKDYVTDNDIVIKANDEIACIAGVIGSRNYETTTSASTIIVEAANFKQDQIQKTSKRINVFTESATRFSKGVDINKINIALLRFGHMLQEIDPNITVYKPVIHGKDSNKQKKVKITTDYVNKILGTNFKRDEVVEILERLRFRVTGKKTLTVNITTDRLDISQPIDLVEEVARINDIDKIVSLPPIHEQVHVQENKLNKMIELIRKELLKLEVFEVKHYNLVSHELNNKTNIFNFEKAVKIINPISDERSEFAFSSLSKLVEIVKYNRARKLNNNNFFVIEDIYHDNHAETSVAIILSNPTLNHKYSKNKINNDFYLLKGILADIFTKIGHKHVVGDKLKDAKEIFHPNISASLTHHGEVIGKIGKLHPTFCLENDMEDVYYAEVLINRLVKKVDNHKMFENISQFPIISRDFTILLPSDFYIDQILSDIKKITNIVKVEAIDLYEKPDSNEKSISIRVEISNNEKTLTDEEIKQISSEVIQVIENHKGVIN